MDFTAGIFESDLILNEAEVAAGRRATAAALARCKQRFAGFLSGPDIPARFDLIEPDLRQVCADVVAEYGGDENTVINSVTSVLAAGAFCDKCKAWKSGPRAGGCTCDGDSSEPGADCDVKAEDEPEDDAKKARVAAPMPPSPNESLALTPEQMQKQLQSQIQQQSQTNPNQMQPDPNQTQSSPQQMSPVPGGQMGPSGQMAPSGQMPLTPGQVPGQQSMVASRWTVVSEALVTEKMPKVRFGDDSLNGPSPKIDKRRWKPNALNEKGNLPPIETEGKGSRHPTIHQDVAQIADHTKDPHEQTEAVLKHETLPSEKGEAVFDAAGFDTKRNITQYPTRTFPNRHQEKPVTREVFPRNAAQDPERNPILDSLESEEA